MKNTCILLLLIISSAVTALGQSVADQLRVAECSFRLYDGPTELKLLDQMITMRSVNTSSSGLKTFGRVYHIEMTYKGAEVELKNALIEFLDEQKRPLHATRMSDTSRFMKVDTLGYRPSPKVRYIAISLEGIPLRLLDEVVSIRISKEK